VIGLPIDIKVPFEVIFEGQAVAAVAATTPEQAEDAIKAIKVKYEELPHVCSPEDAIKPDAPVVVTGDPNVEPKGKKGDPAQADAAFATCDAVVEADYKTPVIHHCCLETHGMVIDYRGGDTATVYATTQGVFSVKTDAVKAL